jgi:hypothetical protein
LIAATLPLLTANSLVSLQIEIIVKTFVPAVQAVGKQEANPV